ncbi:MAG: DNA translocase FtsK 4TM domain-containing protein, partial [Phycisphaerae bacterium]|nr:DNA translocase FtsK 4TM domain-containing protein [Phycisphaerae bacterium]
MAETGRNNRLTHALLLVFYSFALLACAGYSWTDWPSSRLAAHPWPVANLCGPVGAWLAYQALSFLGYAVFVLLVFAAALSLLRLLNREIADLPLRGTGAALLVLSISAISHLLIPSLDFPASNPLPFTAGGVIGSLLASFLLAQLSRWGSALVLTAGVLVGLLLAADTSVLFLLQLLWSKLSILLAKVPVLRVVLRRPIALAGALPRINPHRSALQQIAVPAGGGTAVALEPDEDEDEDELAEVDEDQDYEEDQESTDELPVKVHGLKDRPAGKAKPGLRVAAKAIAKPKALLNYQLPPLDLLEQPEYT